jgi:ribonuclease E
MAATPSEPAVPEPAVDSEPAPSRRRSRKPRSNGVPVATAQPEEPTDADVTTTAELAADTDPDTVEHGVPAQPAPRTTRRRRAASRPAGPPATEQSDGAESGTQVSSAVPQAG